jgi:cysteine-rich repeat protein
VSVPSSLLLGLVIVGGLACGDSNTDSVVVVTVKAAPDVPSISQLRVTIAIHPDAGSAVSEVQLFPPTPSPTPLAFDASFALVIPRHRQGNLEVVVEALDMQGALAVTGAGSVPIMVGGRTALTILLGWTNTDAAVPDDGPADQAPDSAPSDALVDGGGMDEAPAAEMGAAETAAVDGAGTGGAGGAAGVDGGTGEAGGAGGGGMGGVGGTGIDAGGGTGGSVVDAATGEGGTADGSRADRPDDIPSLDATDGAREAPADIVQVSDTADGSVDISATACSATVPCPVYPKCRIQPACDTSTGLCSQPAQCSVCGNGVVEFAEECDDGDTASGDHCSSTCKIEYCGDGIVQSYPLAGLSLVYLARSCGVAVPQDIWMIWNGVEVARDTVKQTCDCEPGIVTIPVTDPAFLALGNNGSNIVEVHTHAEISWAVVAYESPSGPGERYPVDSGSNGAAQYRRPNLCTNGSLQGAEVGISLTLAGGEQCDHGNLNGTPGDQCTANCLVQ